MTWRTTARAPERPWRRGPEDLARTSPSLPLDAASERFWSTSAVEGSPSFSRRTASTSFAVGCSPKLLAPLLPAEPLLLPCAAVAAAAAGPAAASTAAASSSVRSDTSLTYSRDSGTMVLSTSERRSAVSSSTFSRAALPSSESMAASTSSYASGCAGSDETDETDQTELLRGGAPSLERRRPKGEGMAPLSKLAAGALPSLSELPTQVVRLVPRGLWFGAARASVRTAESTSAAEEATPGATRGETAVTERRHDGDSCLDSSGGRRRKSVMVPSTWVVACTGIVRNSFASCLAASSSKLRRWHAFAARRSAGFRLSSRRWSRQRRAASRRSSDSHAVQCMARQVRTEPSAVSHSSRSQVMSKPRQPSLRIASLQVSIEWRTAPTDFENAVAAAAASFAALLTMLDAPESPCAALAVAARTRATAATAALAAPSAAATRRAALARCDARLSCASASSTCASSSATACSHAASCTFRAGAGRTPQALAACRALTAPRLSATLSPSSAALMPAASLPNATSA